MDVRGNLSQQNWRSIVEVSEPFGKPHCSVNLPRCEVKPAAPGDKSEYRLLGYLMSAEVQRLIEKDLLRPLGDHPAEFVDPSADICLTLWGTPVHGGADTTEGPRHQVNLCGHPDGQGLCPDDEQKP